MALEASSSLVTGAEDTIVAVATPAGRGALAVVRLSGPKAFLIAQAHVQSWPASPRQSHLTTIHAGERILDQAIVVVFEAPNSFTGEDTVEFSTHGGHAVPGSIIAALISSGARQALAGEFTRRAILNGKLDVLQAEAIADLIDARSHAMQRNALAQLDGGLSRRLLSLRGDLIALEALVAYDVDFPEEDDGPVPRSRIEKATNDIVCSLRALLATAPAGEIIRDGALVVIAGAPNVGKSSLFNALIGSARAIVTEIPGTTRDALEAIVDGKSWPLRLIDTAGLRKTNDKIELLGIEVSERYLAEADIVLACADTDRTLEKTARAIEGQWQARVIPVRTKSDLVTNRNEVKGSSDEAVLVSAETGEGLQGLLNRIDDVLTELHGGIVRDDPILTRARHRFALASACNEIEQFDQAWRSDMLPATVAAVHLRTAVYLLEELIGTIDVEQVFDVLFSSFCVGK